MSESEKRVPRWYVVHTYSGYENKVAANLERIVENRKLQDQIVDIKIPVEKVIELKNNQEREVERKIFPGYVMVKMLMDDNTRYIVRNVRGVTGFVGSATDPIPLTEQEVEALSSDFAVSKEEQETIKVGDYVQINDEGFTAPGGGMWTGVVKSVDYDNKTVKVGGVGLYGSETVLEVAIDKVETY